MDTWMDSQPDRQTDKGNGCIVRGMDRHKDGQLVGQMKRSREGDAVRTSTSAIRIAISRSDGLFMRPRLLFQEPE
jgi:hypothetical protein